MGHIKTLPGLIAQEYKSLSTIIQIRFVCLFKAASEGSDDATDEDELLQLCTRVLNDY